jgi:hypothetical protein
MSLFAELRRRNVFRVGAAYLVGAWLVIQVVETIFPAFGFGDAAVRIGVTVLAIGLVPVLVFAWAFEITPEGLKLEKDVDRSRSITAQTGKKLDRLIMVALALALGFFAFDKFVLSGSREASIAESARQEGRAEALLESYGDKSIVVLPFADMSPGKDQGYLSDGIAEELLNLLARVPDLRVISRTSAFAFKNKDLEVSDIAERLHVAHALEGSIRSEDAWCGGVTGDVESPIQVPLEGSSFAATRLADRDERPTQFPCACSTVDGEPGAMDGCYPVPM